MSGGSLEGNAGKDPRVYHIHNTSYFNFMSGGSLERHAGEDPRMSHVHNLTLCLEDPLREMLGRIPGCTTSGPYAGGVRGVCSNPPFWPLSIVLETI